MSRVTGLHFVIAAAILQLQASNSAVLRNTGTTIFLAETQSQTPTQVSSLADSTIHQDLLGQTTLPPITSHASTDTDTNADTDITTEIPTQYQTVSDIQPQLSRIVLSRSELQLGGQSPLADTTEMDNNPALVPTTELVSVGRRVPEVGKPTVDIVVTITSQRKTVSIPKVPSIVHFRKIQTLPTPSNVQEKAETLPIPNMVSENSETSPDNIVERQHTNVDSFISTTVRIMAHAIDVLRKEELKNHVNEESYEVSENVNDTKQEEWEDDDSSKPVFQSNVPIVNEESVPMRVHMDIVPQGFPEDLDGPTFYPNDLDGSTTDAMNSLGEKSSDNPWGKETFLEDAPLGQDSAGKNGDKFLKIQQQMRHNRHSDTFEKLVDLHKDLAGYAANYDIKMFKGISDREMDVLLRNSHNAAEQLKYIIPIIFEEIDDKMLKDSLKTFLGSVSEPNSEPFIVLNSLPPLQYS